MWISIHAPTRGATNTQFIEEVATLFQSTLPREERLNCSDYYTAAEFISIHAPTRGATQAKQHQRATQKFQSTLPREERPRMTAFLSAPIANFNPRSHERSDGVLRHTIGHVSVISIHAPTRGATWWTRSHTLIKLFQSTLPREERPKRTQKNRTVFRISIHAPTRGATNRTNVIGCGLRLFQSTLPREERPKQKRQTAKARNFNPRSHERSDTTAPLSLQSFGQFQSTLPREERQQYCTKNLFIFIQYRQ